MPEEMGVTAGAADQQTGVDDLTAAGSEQEPGEAQGKMVPLDALQDERSKRQALAEELAEVRREISYLKTHPQSVKQEPVVEVTDEEFFVSPVKALQKILEARDKLRDSVENRKSLARQFDETRTRHSEDFDDVWAFAERELGHLSNVFMSEANPVEAAYEYAKNHPKFSKSAGSKAAKELFDKANKNISKPGTLTDAGGASPTAANEAELMRNAKSEDFDKFWEDIKHGKKSFFR
jgi:hypothetical protein